MNNDKVIIMMATFNGEKYLSEQLDSLINQSYINWELIVSDDNSQDNTVKILEEYQKRDPRIVKILHNEKVHGPFANYFNVMSYVKKIKKDYQFFFYCDQDDVWTKDKIEIQIESLKGKSSEPAFCYSDLEICDMNCKSLGDRMSNHINTQFYKNPYNEFLKEQYVWGTAMAHNKKLWDLILIEDVGKVKNLISHDSYISRYAAVYAKIQYISKPLVNYRRVGNNVTDTPNKYSIVDIIKKCTLKFPKIVNNAAMTYWNSLYFLDKAPKNTVDIENLKLLFNGNLISKIKILKKYRLMKEENLLGKSSTFLILFSNLYRVTKIFQLDYKKV
ncbi:glycosyltransferase [Limosilactobacillus reuteri]|uniref:glycosyltransferase n=1 Tax=Limosilactobacillus reuteri TaxID=1598 RepID=UPI0023312486|nr:glycosyltransferase [Limosilactobacillus reuteri]